MLVSPSIPPRRTHVWLEGLGDWAWPGSRPQAVPMPPEWVPSLPPPVAFAAAGASASPVAPSRGARSRGFAARRPAFLALTCLVAAACTVVVLDARPALERLASFS